MSEFHSSYEAAVRWEGERRGLASSVDGLPSFSVAAPPAFSGPSGIWSPEHLFVLSVAACWVTTFIAVIQASKFEVVAIDCPGTGTVERGDDRRYRVAKIVLRPRVVLHREDDRERALRLMEKAEGACLIRNSMSADVTFEAEIAIEATAASQA